MEALVNQHSFLIAGIVVFAVAWFLVRRRSRWLRRGVVAGTLVLLAALLVALRPGGGDIEAVEDLERALSRGQPIALEFFSNW